MPAINSPYIILGAHNYIFSLYHSRPMETVVFVDDFGLSPVYYIYIYIYVYVYYIHFLIFFTTWFFNIAMEHPL